ncbi:hypothetical protein F66182_2860 [Fusarium sp. NRRL 66182]|nr:hypothetical protein F66182_2860 [Fusarium sp. NRRL 66182]
MINSLTRKQRTNTLTQDLLSAPLSPSEQATTPLKSQDLSKAAQELLAGKEITRRSPSLADQLSLIAPKMRDHGDDSRIQAQNAKRDIANRCNGVKEACASIDTTITTGCAQTTSTSLQKTARAVTGSIPRMRRLNRVNCNVRGLGATPDNWETSQVNHGPSTSLKLGSLSEIRATDTILDPGVPAAQHQCSSLSISIYTADVKEMEKGEVDGMSLQKDNTHLAHGLPLQKHRTEARNQTMDAGVHVPGDFPARLIAEDDIADLSSKRSGQVKEEGLWEAVKECLCRVTGYGMWLLRLYWEMVRPVFDVRSQYWNQANRGCYSWKDLASLCLAFPLLLVFLLVAIWTMEFTAIAIKCKDKEWDCMAVETLSMFRRSLTGAYD